MRADWLDSSDCISRPHIRKVCGVVTIATAIALNCAGVGYQADDGIDRFPQAVEGITAESSLGPEGKI